MNSKPTLVYGSASDIGMVRSENQDTCGIFPPGEEMHERGKLFIVADGMGGHRGGREASSLAVSTIEREFFANTSDEIPDALAKAMQSANEAVYTKGHTDPDLEGMGTTCVAMVVQGARVFVAHIGDSRAYRLTKRQIRQVTADHSAVAEMQRRGILTEEEAKSHPERSVLYRALGTRSVADIDVQSAIEVTTTEWFVLCTDGLSNMVDDKEIHEIVMGNPPQQACDELVRLANERGGYDNITIEVVQVSVRESFIEKLLP